MELLWNVSAVKSGEGVIYFHYFVIIANFLKFVKFIIFVKMVKINITTKENNGNYWIYIVLLLL